MKRRLVLLAVLVLALIPLAACGGPKVEWEIKIDGAVDNPTTISYAELTRMKQVKLENVLMRKSQGEDEIANWEGPSLDDVFAKVSIKASASGVTVTASDGYAMQMTLDDLKGGIIALKCDGKSLADDERGPLRIVIPERSSKFWVAQVVEITFE